MLPTFLSSGRRAVPKRSEPSPSGRVERVHLVQDISASHECLRQFENRIGVIEGYAGDEVLVRFGDTVIQVPPRPTCANHRLDSLTNSRS